METVTITLERYENMSKEIDRKVSETENSLKRSIEAYEKLYNEYKIVSLQLENILKIIEEQENIKFYLKVSEEVIRIDNII